MGVLKFFARLVLFLIILTVVGQLRWNGLSLEQRYHGLVNSDKFQAGWANVTRPFRWLSGRFGVSEESTRPETAR